MREQRGLDATSFRRRASLPARERHTDEYTSYHHVGSRSGTHPEDRPYITTTRTSARRYDLTPYQREERRTEELPRQGKHPMFYIGISMLIMLACFTAYVMLPPALQKWSDDRIYGYPRTFQTDANVGHGDSNFPISHFIAVNLNGRIEVLEIPQGDAEKLSPHLYLIARLAMQGSDLVPVTVSFADMNGDGKPDMVVTFNGTQWIFFNNGTTFVPKL